MKTKRMLRVLHTYQPHEVLEVELYYDKGGMNYFAGRTEPRGIWLSVTPCVVTENFREYRAFSGTKVLVKEMKRFTQKAFDTFHPDEDLVERVIDQVVMKNQIVLKKEKSWTTS